MAIRYTKIRTSGLRAADRELSLEPLTVLRGGIGAGKSSICDAVRIAHLGCVPAIGRDVSATARIMRGRELRVDGELSDGRTIERGYRREGESLKQFATASWLPPKSKLTDAAEAIRGLVGRDDREAAEHLDLRELLGCSPAERARRIEELLDASGIPVAELEARAASWSILRLAGVALERMPEDTDAAAAAADGARQLLEDGIPDVLPGGHEALGEDLRSGGLPLAIANAGERKRRAAEQLRRQIAARAELEDRVAELDAPAAALADVEARRERAVDQRSAANRDLQSAEEAAEIRSEVEPKIPVLQQALATAEGEFLAAREQLPRAQAAGARADAITDPDAIDAPAVAEPDPTRMRLAEDLAKQAAEEQEMARAIEIPEPLSIAQEEADYRAATDALQRAECSPWRQVDVAVASLLETSDGEQPLSDRRRELVAALSALAAEHGGEIIALRAAAAVADQRLTEATERRDQRREQIEVAKARRDELYASAALTAAEATQVREAAEEETKEANDRTRKLYAAAVADREVLVDTLRQERQDLRETAKKIRERFDTANSKHDEARSDLRAAQERLAGIASVSVDVESATRLRDAAQAVIGECDQQLAALRGADSLRKEMQQLLRQIDRHTAEQKVWAALEWALQRCREQDLAARAGGLQARMRDYLRAAGRTEEPYLRASRAACDFGLRRDGEEISVEALSGGEYVIFTTALLGAIHALRRPEVSVVLVEANEVGLDEGANQLLALCEAIVQSGDVAQVLVATNLPMDPSPAWTVIDLGPVAERAAMEAVA